MSINNPDAESITYGPHRSRKVVAINGWGKERVFSSGREAARELRIPQSGVNYCLTGKRKKSGGYRFRYADE